MLAQAGRGLGLDWSAQRVAGRLREPGAANDLVGELLGAASARRLLLVVGRMVDDTGDGRGLPLLAYTLSRLYEQARDARTALVSGVPYDSIGGVQGALVDHANAALAAAAGGAGDRSAGDHRGAGDGIAGERGAGDGSVGERGAGDSRAGVGEQRVLAAMLRLVTVDGEGRPTRRQVPLEDLTDAVRAVLTPFVTRRLLTVNAAGGGPATIEVAHERLLIAWPTLHEAIREASDRLRQRGQAEAAAAEWEHHGRPANRLWSRGLAGAALNVLDSGELGPTTRLFLTASRRRAQQRLVGAFGIVTVLLVVATSLGIVASLQRHSAYGQRDVADLQSQVAESRRRTAVADRLLTLADTSRVDIPTAALRYAMAAGTVAPERDTTDRVRGNLLETSRPCLPRSRPLCWPRGLGERGGVAFGWAAGHRR
ncbi:hypothetical protein [Frankia sp. R43]|uniref:nSTAND1 domain-containing NTPase n=1 Tax=Frankia sp. R43 TaxID=269536 RepID=UPI0006CA1A20|nr:hypothetical protein [Frankia sp. R43]